jgi:hypothetical protein
VVKAQQYLYNLRRLKIFGMAPKTLTNFYRCTIESILLSWYVTAPPSTAWFSRESLGQPNASPGGTLDLSHPSHGLFTLLPSDRRRQFRCIRSKTERLKNCFYHQAIRLSNSHH